jgi:phosphate-selective porin OprO/OprP
VKSLSLALATALAVSATAAGADVDLSPTKGLRIRGDWGQIHLGGRLHLDYAAFDDDLTPIDDDFDVRRGRPMLDVKLGDDFKAKLEYDFASDSGWRAAWIQWDGIDWLKIRAGNQTVPFGLEEVSSSNDIVFNERSLISALAPGYGTGVVLANSGRLVGKSRYTIASGVYTDPFGKESWDRHGSDHLGFAGRATFAPLVRKRAVVQLGASFDYRDIKGDDSWSVSRRPGSKLAPPLIGAALTDIDATKSFGVEAAAMFGPVLFAAEWMRSSVDRTGASLLSGADFDGFYAQASWVVTGERHRYSKGLATFGPVKPRSKLGAVEIGARWARLDLSDSGVNGGDAGELTVALNWWIRANARLNLNYARVKADIVNPLLPPPLFVDDDPNVFGLRFIYHL